MTPLWVISLFLSLTEAVAGLLLSNADARIQAALTAFVIVFPLLVAGAFFAILWNRPYVLYPPTEFGEATDVDRFVGALRGATSPEHAPSPPPPTVLETAITAQAPELSAVVQAVPVEPEAPWYELFEAKEYDRAVAAVYKSASKKEGMNQPVTEAVAGYMLLEKRRSEGLAHFEQVFREMPTESEPYVWLANAQARWGDASAALKTLDRGLASGADKVALSEARAPILKELGKLDEAIALLQDVAAEKPDVDSPFLLIAELLADADRTLERESALRNALQRKPASETALFQLAALEEADGRHEQALKHYRRLVDLDTKNTASLTLLGNVYLSLSLNGKALEAYERANEIANSKEAWILANIGNVLKNQGFYPAAVRHLRQAVAIEPDSVYAQERLADALKKVAEEDEREAVILRSPSPGITLLPGA